MQSSEHPNERFDEESFRSYGLQGDWARIETALVEVLPVYEKVNRFISLGTDLRIRKEGVRILLEALSSNTSYSILDLGSGPGKMTEVLLDLLGKVNPNILQVDALLPMMRKSSQENSVSLGVVSVYENLPFRGESFDAAMAGFSIRDARDLYGALEQTNNCLRPSGFFLIVDLSKPDSKLNQALLGAYWRVIAPLLALLASPGLGLKFAALHTTFKKLPIDSKFISMARAAGFVLVLQRKHMFGGSTVLLFQKVIST